MIAKIRTKLEYLYIKYKKFLIFLAPSLIFSACPAKSYEQGQSLEEGFTELTSRERLPDDERRDDESTIDEGTVCSNLTRLSAWQSLRHRSGQPPDRADKPSGRPSRESTAFPDCHTTFRAGKHPSGERSSPDRPPRKPGPRPEVRRNRRGPGGA